MSSPTNHSLTATITVSSDFFGGSGNKLKNNAVDSAWLANTTPAWAKLDLGSAKTFDTIEVWQAFSTAGRRPKDYTVQLGDDGTNWDAAIASGTFGNNDLGKIISFASQTKRWILLTITTNYNGDASYMGYIGEIRVFTGMTDLIPTGSAVNTTGWNGTYANLHDESIATITYYDAPCTLCLLDVGSAKWLDSMQAFLGSDAGNRSPKEFYVWISADALTWTCLGFTSVAQKTLPGYIVEISFSKVLTRYIGWSTMRTWVGVQGVDLSELRIYDQAAPTAFSAITGLVAGSGIITASWTAYEAAACKAMRVYIRADSAPDTFGTSSAYFLEEIEADQTSLVIKTLADKTTMLVNGTQYYVIVRVVFNDGTEDTNTTSLNQTPDTVDFPAVGNVRDTDTVDGVPGTLLSNKILKSNATGDGAGNYDDDNLAVGNVRPVAFGLALTGDLSNLVATDGAYVTLENSRNNDNGTVAADILITKSVLIRNVTIDGTAAGGGGTGSIFASPIISGGAR